MSDLTTLYDKVTEHMTKTKSNDKAAKRPIAINKKSRIDNPRSPGPVKNKDKPVMAEPLEYEVVSDETVKFTRDYAAGFLKLKTFEGERPVRETNIQTLYDEYKMGRFLWQNVTLAAAQLNGDTYRINGQHTSWMRLNVDDSIGPKVRVMVYKVKTPEQLRALYASFDRGAPRTPGHLGRVLLIGTKAGEGIPQSYLNHLIGGYRLFAGSPSTRVQRISISELVATIEKKHAQLFNDVGMLYAENYEHGTWVRRSAVLGAMLTTVDKCGIDIGRRFWEPVLSAIGLDSKKDVRWQIRRFIEQHRMNGSTKGISQEQLYSTILVAWNSWRTNETVKMIKTANNPPKVR